jgi:hypothetical protein
MKRPWTSIDAIGVPRWAVLAAWLVPLCIVPSATWRTWKTFETQSMFAYAWYPIFLSVLSLSLGTLTLGLVYRWGEVLPRWWPVLTGRTVRLRFAVIAGYAGATAILLLTIFAGGNALFHFLPHGPVLIGPQPEEVHLKPPTGWQAATYYPLVLWAPLLYAVTHAYRVRRRRFIARYESPGDPRPRHTPVGRQAG